MTPISNFMSLAFQKKIEDFRCEHCGELVSGNGYTNHCPKCLYSRHVDVTPGDRKNPCGGLMKPEGLEIKGGEYKILHVCEKCGIRKKNKTNDQDNPAAIVELSTSKTL